MPGNVSCMRGRICVGWRLYLHYQGTSCWPWRLTALNKRPGLRPGLRLRRLEQEEEDEEDAAKLAIPLKAPGAPQDRTPLRGPRPAAGLPLEA